MNILTKVSVFITPAFLGTIAFPVDLWITDTFSGVRIGWLLGIQAVLYCGIGLGFLVSFFRKQRLKFWLLLTGLLTGSVLFYLVLNLIFGLACATGGGCL